MEKTATLEDMIPELEAIGFKRWTKPGKDRLYVKASLLGLCCTYHKTGSISRAMFGRYEISNSEAYRMKACNAYIDLINHVIVCSNAYMMEKICEIIGVKYERGSEIIKLPE